MDKIKIIVACHKQAVVHNDSVYMPLHVGKALHPDLELSFAGDNTGDNISNLNPYYSELTAQYWGWKNLDCEYIGLAHYRRYFETVITKDNIDSIMNDCDVILANPIHLNCSVDKYQMNELVPEDIIIFYKLMEHSYPYDYSLIQKYFTGNRFYPCNMFICKKTIFDKFAEWQFDILFKLQKLIRFSSYSREKRILGFLSENLLPIYMLLKKHYNIKTLPIVDMIGSSIYPFKQSRKTILINDIKFKLKKQRDLSIYNDYTIGLNADGVLSEIQKL